MNFFEFQIGNAYVDQLTQYSGSYDYYWSHALLSDEIHEGITINCNFSAIPNVTEACITYLQEVDLGDIFPYDIYAPWCDTSSGSPSVCLFHRVFKAQLSQKLQLINFCLLLLTKDMLAYLINSFLLTRNRHQDLIHALIIISTHT